MPRQQLDGEASGNKSRNRRSKLHRPRAKDGYSVLQNVRFIDYVIGPTAKDEGPLWLRSCNPSRLHFTLNYVRPMQFEQHWPDKHVQRASSSLISTYGSREQSHCSLLAVSWKKANADGTTHGASMFALVAVESVAEDLVALDYDYWRLYEVCATVPQLAGGVGAPAFFRAIHDCAGVYEPGADPADTRCQPTHACRNDVVDRCTVA